jgi:hypothetical protein
MNQSAIRLKIGLLLWFLEYMLLHYRPNFLIKIYVIVYNFPVQSVINITFNNPPHMIPRIVTLSIGLTELI